MKYLSVCSGIEAATVAWHPLGWEPVGFSEIEKFPSNVLAHHYPDVPNYGDMTKHEQWPTTDIDVLVGGTPCQSFSVAGLRQGMADPRGNLALVYLAIAEQYRPRWLVWENVPGVLSSNGGRDFGSIIGGMVELGYSPSWRVLDAQYFGVPQRRRRVFIVASSGDWRDSAEVLFEPQSLRRNPAPSRETGQSVAASIGASPASSSSPNVGNGQRKVVAAWPAEVAATMNTAFADKMGLEDQHALNGASYFTLASGQANAPIGFDVCSALTCLHEAPIVGALTAKGPEAMGAPEVDGNHYLPVAFAQNQRDEVRLMDKAGALAAEPGAKQQTYVKQDMAVRRLAPLECERLQGFPDNYTNIPGASDSGRYKALGNSMAVPVMRWIGERISVFLAQ